MNPERSEQLPNEVVYFNPSEPKSVDRLIYKHGPESVYEIAQVLIKAACDDMDIAVDRSGHGL